MIKASKIRMNESPCEDGYMLVGVIFMLTIMIVSMTVAAPRIMREIQRDRELETMHRGQQYTRAIRLYYRKFGAYPASIDSLAGTNGIRFLRKRYTDPITGLDDWKPIAFGQNKTPLAIGFFGQPIGLGGIPIAGAGLGAGSSIFGATPPVAGTGSTPAGGAGAPGSGDSGTDSNSTLGLNTDGQTFGGGPIIGVSPVTHKQSIMVYKTMNYYNEWEFLYSPLSDQMINNGNQINLPPLQGGAPGAPPPAPNAPGSNPPQ
jgi:type II secretory pathway pseudopilin PulG